ncbi:MAG: exodeoxyribonuclease III [Candidatus Lokiarchaeota archaeon]|nr:exodeoxyribonuclease III [Candidatus Lokiarchaeota archaeon]MBD3201007.1 exodeoxyribonuclease III [Candidatus Lokiarchaeota archaeon]
MKEFISWNVNGIKSSLEKGLMDFIKNREVDAFLFQETKSNRDKVKEELEEIHEYSEYWSSSKHKKGYSGVLTLVKETPIEIRKGIGVKKFDEEGRVISLEYKDFFLINVYFPNAGAELKRLDDKMWFNKEFLMFCEELRKDKPLIIGGDFNVAHKEKDLANPDSNQQNAGFTIEEREWFSRFLDKGYLDTFREFEPDGGKYTFWTYRYNAREKNIGWRIDYFIINREIKKNLKKSYRLENVKGSDHCPIGVKLNI